MKKFELSVQNLSDLCIQRQIMIATAESCTGGLIAGALTEVAGSSAFFDRGFVTYSNESKQALLGVDLNILENYGAVSAKCSQAMAQGALNNSNAQIAVSVTGIAGPGGGSENKPVGLVYVGIATHETVDVVKCNFSGTRSDIRNLTVFKALDLLIEAARAI